MQQFADVTRFCAIEGRLCDKHIPYQGPDTFFFAYPLWPVLVTLQFHPFK